MDASLPHPTVQSKSMKASTPTHVGVVVVYLFTSQSLISKNILDIVATSAENVNNFVMLSDVNNMRLIFTQTCLIHNIYLPRILQKIDFFCRICLCVTVCLWGRGMSDIN